MPCTKLNVDRKLGITVLLDFKLITRATALSGNNSNNNFKSDSTRFTSQFEILGEKRLGWSKKKLFSSKISTGEKGSPK